MTGVESRFHVGRLSAGAPQSVWARAGVTRGANLLSPGGAAAEPQAGAAPVADAASATPTARQRADAKLREKLGEFSGGVFYATLIQEMEKSTFKTELMHGGRGEEAFRGQLTQHLAQRMGRAPHDPVTNRLYQAARKRLAAATPAASTGEVSP